MDPQDAVEAFNVRSSRRVLAKCITGRLSAKHYHIVHVLLAMDVLS